MQNHAEVGARLYADATPFTDTASRCGVTPVPSDACNAGWSELILDINTILSFAPDAHVLVVQAQPRTPGASWVSRPRSIGVPGGEQGGS